MVNKEILVEQPRYAGFWIRFSAALLDQIFISMILGVYAVVCLAIGAVINVLLAPETAESLLGIFAVVAIILAFFIALLYEPYLLSSKHQATYGMLVLDLKIVGLDYEPISFGKAFLRLLAQYISALILYIGYLMIAFTERKQGLHDMMVGTYVLRK